MEHHLNIRLNYVADEVCSAAQCYERGRALAYTLAYVCIGNSDMFNYQYVNFLRTFPDVLASEKTKLVDIVKEELKISPLGNLRGGAHKRFLVSLRIKLLVRSKTMDTGDGGSGGNGTNKNGCGDGSGGVVLNFCPYIGIIG